MTNEGIQDTIDALDDLLDAERKALLAGELDKISRLHERKTALVEQLRVQDLQDQAQMTSLTGKIDRNQALLSSALDGIRSVATRLAAVRHVRETLETYDANGLKKAIKPQAEKSLEKRA